jgi:hypothetical protein
MIVGANTQPLSLMQRSGFAASLGPGALFDTLEAALASVSPPETPDAPPGMPPNAA